MLPDEIAVQYDLFTLSVAHSNVIKINTAELSLSYAIFTKEHLQCSVVSTKSVPKQFHLLVLSIKLSTSSLLTVSGCYGQLSSPACTLLPLMLSSQIVLIGISLVFSVMILVITVLQPVFVMAAQLKDLSRFVIDAC
jgi:hypothetical protein